MRGFDGQAERYDKKRWGYLFLSVLIMLCLGTVYSWSVFRGPVEQLFGIGKTQSGFPYMVSLAMYAVFMMLTGRHIDKYNPGYIIMVGAAFVASGWIISSFAPNIYVLTITYGFLIGAGVGITYGVPMTIIARLFPEKKGLAVGFVLGGFGLSPLITAPIANYFMSSFGIRRTFLILGIVFGILIPLITLPFFWFRFEKLKAPSNSKKKSSNHANLDTVNMIKTSNFKGLYVSFGIGTMIGLMLIGITSSVGSELIKMPQGNVTLLMSLFAIFNGIGRPTFGFMTDKLSVKKSMLISFLLITIAAILMIIADERDYVLFGLAFSIFWFNLGGWLAIAPAATIAMYGTKHYSQNFGVVFTAYGFGAILGVLTSGLLHDISGDYNSIFYLVIVLCLLGGISSQFMIKE